MNKIIVITGGTSGIGKYLTNNLAKNNYVYVLAKDSKKIELVKEELKNNNIDFIKCDLTNNNEIEFAFNYIKRKSKKIDVLINNAAYDFMDNIESYSYNEFEKIINTNLLGKVFCIKNAIPLLKNSDYPNIINIASRLASKPLKMSSAYCCAASAIVMLTKCAALELEDYSIRVNCISPSLTLTPLALKSYSEEEINNIKLNSTRKRLCYPDDIYKLIIFLISKDADFINGENIGINGGILLK